MAWFLRKALTFGPFRLNLSKSGFGLSMGVRGARIGIGPKGSYVHAGRHGIYFKQPLRARPRTSKGIATSVGSGKGSSLTMAVLDVPGIPSTFASCGEEVKRLASGRPPCWEYQLFAAALEKCVGRADAHLSEMTVAEGTDSSPVPDEAALEQAQALLEGISAVSARLSQLINEDFQAAIGAPGQASDLKGLIAVANSVAHGYAGLIGIRNYSMSMKASDYFLPCKEAIAKSAEDIAREVKVFPERLRAGIAGALQAAETGGRQELNLSLVLKVDEAELRDAVRVARDGVMRSLGH
jgi:hypothetical protein